MNRPFLTIARVMTYSMLWAGIAARLNAEGSSSEPPQAAETVLLDKAVTALKSSQYNEAVTLLNQVLSINSSNVVALEYRGCAYLFRNELDRAASDFTGVIWLSPTNARAYYNRGNIYSIKRDTERAIQDFSKSIELDPANALAYKGRAAAYAARHEPDAEIADWNESLRLEPHDAAALAERGAAYSDKGKFPEAVADYERAIRMAPTNYLAYNYLAWLKATCPALEMRNGKIAVENARKACDLSRWMKSTTIDTLAAAYAEIGEFEEAVKYQKQAISLAEKSAVVDAKMKDRLRLFEDNKPYRESPTSNGQTGDR